MSYTLYHSLTHIPEPHFPATESIKQLIETIGRDVVRFRRNTQISYNYVDKARSSCQAINGLIREVDENDDWDSYDKFTEAVDLLEEYVDPVSSSIDAHVLVDFCSIRQQSPRMRCYATSGGIRMSMHA